MRQRRRVGRWVACTRVFCARTKWECTLATIAERLGPEKWVLASRQMRRARIPLKRSGQSATHILAQGVLYGKSHLNAKRFYNRTSHAKYVKFCAQERGPLRRISHAATKSSSLLQQLLAGCCPPLPVSPLQFRMEFLSDGASFPFKSGANKKVRPNRSFVAAAAVCTAQIAGSPSRPTPVRRATRHRRRGRTAGVIMTKSLAL